MLPNAEIGGIAAGSLTSVLTLRRDYFTTNTFRNMGALAYRPGNATGVADYVRSVGDLTPSTGVLNVTSNWSDSTLGSENIYLLYYGLEPVSIRDMLNFELDKLYFPCLEPLSEKPIDTTLADAGFQASSTGYTESDADGGPATTAAETTTANSDNIYRGLGSLVVTNTAAGGYVRHRYNVTPGMQVVWWTVSRKAGGTNAEAVLYDISNSAAIGTTVEHAEEAWQWMRRQETMPSGCRILETRHQGEGDSDVIAWNASSVLFPERNRVIVDTKWEPWKAPVLLSAQPRGYSTSGDVYDAAREEMVPIPRRDYDWEFSQANGHPIAVVFHNNSQAHWFQWPVYIDGRRAYSDIDGPFTLALTETTRCELDLIDAALRVDLFKGPAAPQPKAQARLRQAQMDFADASRQLTSVGPAPAREILSVRSTPG